MYNTRPGFYTRASKRIIPESEDFILKCGKAVDKTFWRTINHII